MENYQPTLAAVLAACMADPEPPRAWETGLAVNEMKVHTGQLIQLMTENKSEALRTVQRLHRNLGHPQPLALAKLLASRNASDVVVEVAKNFQCAACLMYHKPNQVAPASIRQEAVKFNDILQADVLWLKIDSKKLPGLSMIDQCTKFQAAAVLHGEKTEHLVPALERNWLKHFGAPTQLMTDEGRGWLSDKMVEWTTDHCINHQVAPGEAHSRLSLVERRHAVLRKAIEVYMSDLSLVGRDGLKQALVYVVPQLNAQATVAGFSPTQWVLGFQPQLPGVSVLDATSPAQLGSTSNFEDVLMKRNAAKTAIIQAESDQKLRRALLRRYMGNNTPLAVGQSCFYWRDARQPDLVKIRWLGQAKVVLRECDQDGKPLVYWIVHKTQLIRCSPHHVRPDFHETSKTAVDDVKSAVQMLKDLKSRGVTRYLDLQLSNKRSIDDIDEDEEEVLRDEDLEEEHKRRRLLDPEDDFPYSPEQLPGDPAGDQEGVVPAIPLQPTSGGNPEVHPEPVVDLEELPLVPEDQQTSEERQISMVDEPSVEPSPGPSPKAVAPEPYLDPTTLALYEKVDGESFEGKRLRFARQETLQFGPRRSSSSRGEDRSAPYDAAREESLRKASEEDMVSHAFTVQDVCQDELPGSWTFDKETGYFELSCKTPKDFWEVKNGCLLRHHVIPRRKLFHPSDAKDLPVPLEALDPLRISVQRMDNDAVTHCTDKFDDGNFTSRSKRSWTGVTVFQLSAVTRKELGMNAQAITAKKTAKTLKVQQQRTVKKDQKGEINERRLSAEERQQFYAAKVKELRSFFENGVWEFSTVDDADPTRVLTSRILLKWAKNPDGSPRAKARLIVRGYNDKDALAGNLETSSPTTTRLGRAILLSTSANKKWRGWTADVSTAFLQGLPQERRLWVKLPPDALQIIGGDERTRMYLIKPVYGQLDAPRRWWLEAVRRLKSLGWIQHELDPCFFMLYEETENVGEDYVPELCGLVCIHVDDLLGIGNQLSKTYNLAEQKLKETFNFRTWDDGSSMEYCGARLVRKEDYSWELGHQEYIQKVKPLTIHRGQQTDDEMTPQDVTQLRGLLGSLQWPAVQSAPHLLCSTSLISGLMAKGQLRAVVEANSLLRFAKQNADVPLRYSPLEIKDWPDLRLTIMFDAAHAVRHDLTSQGGLIAMLTPASAYEGAETNYHILDWKSFRLPRVARSSLSAEAQAGSQAADSAEFICRFWARMLRPDLPLSEILKQKSELQPMLITDAKALYDSFHRDGCSSVTDRRTALEVLVLKDQMNSLGGGMKWISSERQFADSLTKMTSRRLLADRLRHGRIKFTWDPTFTASKKKDKNTRLQNREEFTRLQSREELPGAEHSEDVVEESQRPTQQIVESMAWSRSTMYVVVMFAQMVAARAQPVVVYDDNATMAEPVLVEFTGTRFGSVLSILCCALMFLAVFCFWLGSVWNRKVFQKAQSALLQEVEEKQKRYDKLLQECTEAYDKVVKAELDSIAASERTCRVRESLGDVQLENQVLHKNLRDMKRQLDTASGLVDRAFRELAAHARKCPLMDGEVAMAPHGDVWHIDPNCTGLQQARTVTVRRQCSFCTAAVRTPDWPHPLSGATLRAECTHFMSRNGHVTYEASMS